MKKVAAHLVLFAIFLLLTAQIAHAGSNREIARLGRGVATSLAWRPDGKVLAVGSKSGVWFFDKQMKQVQYIEDEDIQSIQWKSNSKRLLITKENETAEIWSLDDSLSISNRIVLPIEGGSFIWSPDAKWVVVSHGDYQNGNYSGTLQIVDAQTGINKYSIEKLTNPPYPAWSSDSLSLVIQTSDNTLEVIDVQKDKTKITYQSHNSDDYISAFDFGKDKDEIIILNDWDSNAYIWNVKTRQITNKSISEHNDCLPTSLRVSNSGTAFICYGFSGGNDTINVISNSTLKPRQGIRDNILDYDWQPNTSSITIIYNKGLLQTWDTQTDKVESYQLFISPNQIAWSPDSKYIAASSGTYGYDWAYPVAVWAVDKNKNNVARPQPTSIIYPYTSTKWIGWKDPSTLLIYSDNQTFQIALCFTYDLENWSIRKPQKTDFVFDYGICGVDDLPANWKYTIEWSEDFKWVAYTEGGYINIAPYTPNESTKFSLKTALAVQSMTWSPNANYLIVKGVDNKSAETAIELWDVQTGKLIKTLKLSNKDAVPFWSPDSKLFAISITSDIHDAKITVFDTNAEVQFDHIFNSPAAILNWSPDSKKLAIAVGEVSNKQIDIVDALTDKSWFSYFSNSMDLVWSPNSQYLLYGIYDNNSLNLVDVISGKELKSLGPGRINDLMLSPDGTMLALSMEDGTIRIWDVADLMAN